MYLSNFSKFNESRYQTRKIPTDEEDNWEQNAEDEWEVARTGITKKVQQQEEGDEDQETYPVSEPTEGTDGK